MKRLILLVALVPMLAFAGKSEREYWKEKVAPAIEKAKAGYKEGCGCSLDIHVDEGVKKSEDVMSNVRYVCESVANDAKGYCTDDASKKAVCQMKKLVIKEGQVKFAFASGTGTATVDKQSYVNFEMMTRELDK